MDLDRRRFDSFNRKQLAKSIHVVSEDRRLMAGAGDGDATKAGTEKVGMDSGVYMDENALGGMSLGAVAGGGVAVVERIRV